MLLKKYRVDKNTLFDNNLNQTNLTQKSISGGMYTLGSTVVLFILNIIRTTVLARLLLPDDFGVIAMVTVFVGFISMFKDSGLSMATVQRDKISQSEVSNLAWINFIFTLILGAIVLLSSPFVAYFYNKQVLMYITIALSLTFLFEGMVIQHRALLQRQMRFDTLTIISVLSTVSSIIFAIIFASLGFKFWALVIGVLAQSITESLFVLFFCPWKPDKYNSDKSIKSMIHFGLNVSMSSFVNYFARNADNLIIGKFAGAAQLGFYDKAYQLFRLPTNNVLNPIRNVAMPGLSSLQNDHVQFNRYYNGIISLTALLIFPVSIYLYLEADFIIPLILGPNWSESIPIFKLLALGGLIQPITGQSGILMLSIGKSKKYLQWQIFYSVILVLSFIIGIQFGVLGLATAYAIAELFLFFPGLYFNYKNSPVKRLDMIKVLILPLLVSLFGFIVALMLKKSIKSDIFINHIWIAIVFWMIYLLFVVFNNSNRNLIKMLFRNRK